MKKIISLFLCIAIMFTFVFSGFGTINTLAQTEGDFEYTISGVEVKIEKYSGNAATLNIPSILGGLPVTSFDTYAFAFNASLTSVIIPNTVISIADGAFCWCKSLSSVTIPNNVTKIGNSAFHGTALTNVTIPNSVTSIGEEAFNYCDLLKNITIPKSVTSIGYEAFDDN